ncbi:MAG: hypothetical protein NTZ34_08215 [Chloroflexi bacterium]|nr:hypothetical protein [Chloroflexota bacterium]
MEEDNLFEEDTPVVVAGNLVQVDTPVAEADSLEPGVGSTPAAEDNLAAVVDSQEDNPVAAEGNQAAEEDNNPAVAEDNSLAVEDNRVPVEGRPQQACRTWDNKWPPDLTGWHNWGMLKRAECRTHYRTVDRGRC